MRNLTLSIMHICKTIPKLKVILFPKDLGVLELCSKIEDYFIFKDIT